MTTVNVELNNGQEHDFLIENLTEEMVYDLIRQGKISIQQFSEWRSNEYFRGFIDGQELAGNY